MMEPAGNREWLRPIEPAEPGTMPHSIGSYRGICEGLQVYNPQPGVHYRWATAGGNDFLRRQYEGFVPVSIDDPEGHFQRDHLAPDKYGKPQDSYVHHGSLVLMKIPIESYREYRRQKRARYAHKLESATASYLEAGVEQARRIGYTGSRPLYYQQDDHGVGTEFLPVQHPES